MGGEKSQKNSEQLGVLRNQHDEDQDEEEAKENSCLTKKDRPFVH